MKPGFMFFLAGSVFGRKRFKKRCWAWLWLFSERDRAEVVPKQALSVGLA